MWGWLAGCAVLLLAAMGLYAQAMKDGVITINGGKTTVYMKAGPGVITPAAPHAAGLVTIYSNLGTGTNVYNSFAGTGVLGRDVPGEPRPEWLAFAFTPTAEHTVTQIQVGVTYSSGTNEVVMSLNADNAGLPGATLQTWHFENLPTFGGCCTVQTATSAGIPVHQGKQYWLVLRNRATAQDTWDVWNNDFNNVQGTFSNNLGQGWVDGGIQQQGAFGIFGQ